MQYKCITHELSLLKIVSLFLNQNISFGLKKNETHEEEKQSDLKTKEKSKSFKLFSKYFELLGHIVIIHYTKHKKSFKSF